MSWGHLELLWLLPLAPGLAWAVSWSLRRRRRFELEWISGVLQARLRRGGPARPAWLFVLLAAWVAAGTVLALARPRWGTVETQVERRGVDVVLVLDTSLSMAATDLPPNRFFVAQTILKRLLEALPGQRFGLVQAEGVGTTLVPLTEDSAAIELLLEALEPGSAPVPGTLLAPALERALELFPEGDQTHRAIVLLSDGEDHGSALDSVQRKLVEAGVIVHAIAVGTLQGSPIPIPGNPGEFKRDSQGQVVVSRLNPSVLRKLAEATGGVYLEASGPTTDIDPLIAAVRKLRGQVREVGFKNVGEERFQLGLFAAILGTLAWLWLEPNRPLKATRGKRSSVLLLAGVLAAPAPLVGQARKSSSAASSRPTANPVEPWLFNARERTEEGLRRLEKGELEKALQPFESAARLAPQDPRARYNRETVRLMANGQVDTTALETVAREAKGPLAVKAWYNLGNAQLAGENYAQAIQAYRQALLLQPNFLPAKQNLELALRRLKRTEQPSPPQPTPPSEQRGQAPEPSPSGSQPQKEEKQPGSAPREFQDQPDLNADQAAALLAASEQLEKQAQKEARAREAKRRRIADRDW